ncbi:MAG: sugar transferase [Bacteroidetes bacterium]|nr:sugar transferase [Bacteroidota bacterium]
MDLALSLFLLLFTLPVMLLCGIILCIQLKEFPIFIQERGITLDKFRYKIIKFRTMKKNKYNLSEDKESNNIFYKPEHSEKLTKFSKWLRITGLDELPQLLNVIRGKMSLIGPRPLMLSDLEILKQNYPEQYLKRESFNSKPGISGLWQIYGKREKGIDNLIDLENEYEKSGSFVMDLKLILATIPIIVFANHTDAILGSRKARVCRQTITAGCRQ